MAWYGCNYLDNIEKEKYLKDNIEYIDKLNNEGNQTFKLHANEFADLTNEGNPFYIK